MGRCAHLPPNVNPCIAWAPMVRVDVRFRVQTIPNACIPMPVSIFLMRENFAAFFPALAVRARRVWPLVIVTPAFVSVRTIYALGSVPVFPAVPAV